jgi:hypothetical protein
MIFRVAAWASAGLLVSVAWGFISPARVKLSQLSQLSMLSLR